MTYDNLYVISLDYVGHSKTCGYWYLVQSHYMAHTAFRSREALLWWLGVRGLKCDPDRIPEIGTFGMLHIEGQYRTDINTPRAVLDALDGLTLRELSNARYTKAVAVTDEAGIVTVHTVNCNHPREEYDYAESTALYCGGWLIDSGERVAV